MVEYVQEQLTPRSLYQLVIEAQQPWGVSKTDIFDESLRRHMRVFRDLDVKLAKFLEVKIDNPMMNRYGKHDGPFSGPLVGFHHCHLRDDAILIYNLANRCINLVLIVSHAEIEKRAAVATANKIAPFLRPKDRAKA